MFLHIQSRLRYSAIILLVLLGACGKPGASAQVDATLESPLISGPYTIGLSTDRISVCWQTASPLPGKVSICAAGDTNRIRFTGPATNFHAVTLTGLKPGTIYDGVVSSDVKDLGSFRFTTATEKADRFTFFVYGDTRTFSADHARVAEAIAKESVRLNQRTFVVHTGDLAEYGSGADQAAAQFFVPARAFLKDMSLISVRGNHENELFESYFPFPARSVAGHGVDDYYLDYGSVRIIVIDQYSRENMDQRMRWLADLLAGARDKWRFVVFHEPIYSTGSHGGNDEFRRVIEPVLQKGRVHAVFCGHNHNYERTVPIEGITYFTAGGGGAPLRPRRDDKNLPAWSVKFEAVHHFITVSVTPERCTVRAFGRGKGKDATFDEIDRIEIPIECGWPGEDTALQRDSSD